MNVSDPKSYLMSSLQASHDALNVLMARAKNFSEKAQQEENVFEEQCILFRIGEKETYAIPYQTVLNIIQVNAITRVPCVKAQIAGVINQRSELITVLNIKNILGLPEDSNRGKKWILILQKQEKKVGIPSDALIGNVPYRAEDLSQTIDGANQKAKAYIKGLFMKDVAVIDVEAIFNNPELVVNDK